MHKVILRQTSTDTSHELGVLEGGKYVFTEVTNLDDILEALINKHKMSIFDIAELLKDEIIHRHITPARIDFDVIPSYIFHDPILLEYYSPSSLGAVLHDGNHAEMFDYLATYYLADFTGKFRQAYGELLGNKDIAPHTDTPA